MTQIRTAAFGAGWVTTHRHVPAMRAHGGYDVAVLVDRSYDRARAAADRLGVPHARGGSALEHVADLDIEAVTCGTAPFQHFEVVSSALRGGAHALTEKPFTMTIKEGEALVELSSSSRAQLVVMHNFQFARSVRQADAWIRRGRLGRMRAVWAVQLSNPRRRLPEWYDELPLGLFFDESPHLLYLVRHFVGDEIELDGVSVVDSTRGAARTPAQVTAQYRAPIPVTLTMNFEAPVSEWHLLVIGDEGAASVDVFRDIAIFLPNDGAHNTRGVLRSSLRATWAHWLGHVHSGPRHVRGTLLYGSDEVFARFSAAIRTGVPPDSVSGRDALAVLRAQYELISRAGAERAGEFSLDGPASRPAPSGHWDARC
jgi:scyllo-inositol 2-dehydrogenase (NADP+)